MSSDRRIVGLLLGLAILAAPAFVLRTMCVGESCREPADPTVQAPFCSLPADVRSRVAAGFHDGRSPDVLAVTADVRVGGGAGLERPAPEWPSVSGDDSGRVPLVFWGSGVRNGSVVPAGARLDQAAPTVASILGFARPHPEVRSGLPIQGVAAGDGRPRLVLQVVWKGVGSRDLEAAPARWPFLRSLLAGGAGTLDADVGSLPLDPAAALATLGTGGLPRQHGITGTLLRNGDLVTRAWGHDAPFSVIATLADDLDERLGQEPRIGLVGTDGSDRGAIGGNWYLENDRDEVAMGSGRGRSQAARAERLLMAGYGEDDVPDLLVVVLRDSVRGMDAALGRVVAAARQAAGGSLLVVVTATGSSAGDDETVLDVEQLRGDLERRVGSVIEAAAVGGLFLDQERLAATGTAQDQVLRGLLAARTSGGDRVFADVFPGIAVSLERYC